MFSMRSPVAVQLAMISTITAAVSFSACSSPTAEDREPAKVMPPPASTSPVGPTALPALSLHDRSGNIALGGFTDAQLDTIAMMPLVIFQMHTLFTPGGSARIAELRALNPDIVVLGVVDMLTTPVFWDTELTRSVVPMAGDLYDLMGDRWFETEEGDPALMWSNARMVNPMRGATYDADLVRRFVDVICTYALQYPGVIDGVFYDYLSTTPWMYPAGSASGTLDLDGDGVPSDDDPEERAAWAGFQIAVLHDMQERFGEGFIQVANGNLGLREPEARRVLAGVCLEKFPSLVWNVLPQEAIEMARELSGPDGVTPRRGRTWNVLSYGNPDPESSCDIRRLTSMLTGDFYNEERGREGEFPGLDDVTTPPLGDPLSPMRVSEFAGQIEFSRSFENATVRLVFDGFGRVQEASFTGPR